MAASRTTPSSSLRSNTSLDLKVEALPGVGRRHPAGPPPHRGARADDRGDRRLDRPAPHRPRADADRGRAHRSGRPSAVRREGDLVRAPVHQGAIPRGTAHPVVGQGDLVRPIAAAREPEGRGRGRGAGAHRAARPRVQAHRGTEGGQPPALAAHRGRGWTEALAGGQRDPRRAPVGDPRAARAPAAARGVEGGPLPVDRRAAHRRAAASRVRRAPHAAARPGPAARALAEGCEGPEPGSAGRRGAALDVGPAIHAHRRSAESVR